MVESYDGVAASYPLESAYRYSGVPRVIDADTVAFDQRGVSIEGIVAQEIEQTAGIRMESSIRADRWRPKRCGAELVRNVVSCVGNEFGRWGRLIGYCSFEDGGGLNERVVHQGHAMAFREYSLPYVDAEEVA